MTNPLRLADLRWRDDDDRGLPYAVIGGHVVWDNRNGTYDVWASDKGARGDWYNLDPIAAEAILHHIQNPDPDKERS